MRWFRDRGSKGPEPERSEPDPAYLELVADHGLAAFERQLAFVDVVGERDWLLDQDQGLLLLGDDLALPAQIIGSESERVGTWLWAWANPSVEAALTVQAQAAQEIGLRRGIASLTDPQVELSHVIDGWTLALVVSGALEADAYYRCPYEGGAAYVLVELPDGRPRDDRSVARRSFDVINRAMIDAPALISRPSIEAYLRHLGAASEQSDDTIRLDEGTTYGFDVLGRLTTIRTIRTP